LKGSTIGRRTALPEVDQLFWMKGQQGYKGVLKDLNLLQINKDMENSLVDLPYEQFEPLRQMIRQDVDFLKKHGLIDYSLLFAIEIISSENQFLDLN
tara:strand:- start:138 stop:428 length:291 start_codon:yes stop_codon:yes gene_type:complete